MRYKKEFSLKFKLNNKLAYLAGVIVGDGYICNGVKSIQKDPSKDYSIKIELVDKEYCIFLLNLIKEFIKTKSKIKRIIDKRKNRKLRYAIQIRNKWLYKFFVEDLEIPAGKKSGIVSIPELILNNKSFTKWFLAGLYDTDGGKRGHSIGFTTKSKRLVGQTSNSLNKFEIKHFTEKWINKRYKTEFYGIRLYKNSIDKFLKDFPIQNNNKCGSAGAENGSDSKIIF